MVLEQAGTAADESLVRVADFSEQGGYRAMQELLEQQPHPDAVFVANDRMAAGASEAIVEAELAIPEEIGVVGYDQVTWTNLLPTAMTSVSQPAYDLGHESACLLLSRLNGYSGSPRTVVLPTSLNIRASSLRARDDAAQVRPVVHRTQPPPRRARRAREGTPR